MESQRIKILDHLQSGGTITPIEALNHFHCFRLGSRINDLRNEGYNIETTMITEAKEPNFFQRLKGEKKRTIRYAEYKMSKTN